MVSDMITWKETTVSDLAEAFSGYAFASEDLVDNGIPVLKIGNIQNKEVSNTTDSFYDKEITSKLEKYILRKQDFLIAMTGAGSVGRVGKMRIIDKDYLINQRVAIVRSKDSINADFLYYYFTMPFVERYLYSLGIGAGQPNISAKDILKTKLEIPDLNTQYKIASVLSAYDELIENNNKRIKILEQMAENLYKEWFVRFRFPNYENTEFENGIPKGWEVKRLSEYGRIETGKTPSTEKPENYGEDIMFVKTPDMHGNIFVIKTEEYLSQQGHLTQPKKLLPENSIMVSCIGTAGVVAINYYPSHTNQQINSIILNNEKYLEWLYFTCKSLKGTIECFGATGATMTNLSKGKFEKLKVFNPPEKLIYAFNYNCKSIFEKIKYLLKENENLTKQRDLLLPRLMSGKLEV